MIAKNDKVVAEQWLESLPPIDKAHYVKLLQLDVSVGQDIIKCALRYKFKYEEKKYLDYLSSLPNSELKREYFKIGILGWFQWLYFKNKACYRDNAGICNAFVAWGVEESRRQEIARNIENATARGMETAINNTNYDKQWGPYAAGARSTSGAYRR